MLPGTPANGTVNLNPADPAGYVLTGLDTQSVNIERPRMGHRCQFHHAHPLHRSRGRGIKFGVNARIRNRSGDQYIRHSERHAFPTLPLTSAVYGNNVNYYQDHYPNGPQIDGAAMRAVLCRSLGGRKHRGRPIGNALD